MRQMVFVLRLSRLSVGPPTVELNVKQVPSYIIYVILTDLHTDLKVKQLPLYIYMRRENKS
jgi:hypothetical protein